MTAARPPVDPAEPVATAGSGRGRTTVSPRGSSGYGAGPVSRSVRHAVPPARPLGPARLGAHPRHHDLRRQGRVRQDRRHRPRRGAAAGRPCVEAGINLFDTADVYSWGVSEEILGEALQGRRDSVLVATKARMRMGDGPNDAGLSRHHLVAACEASLRRLGTDRIDLYQLHEWDGQTPLEETLRALDDLVRCGKVRYVGCSNYSGWHLMKALGDQRAAGARALRQPADPLHAGGARGRVRAGADRGRPGRRRHGLEPARRRPAHRQVPPRPAAPAGLAPSQRLGRAADPRRGPAPRHRRRRWSRSPPTRGGAPGPGRAGLAARPAGRVHAGHRRAQRGAARRATWVPSASS